MLFLLGVVLVGAAGVAVRLEGADGGLIAEATTDADGRVGKLAVDLDTGVYRLVFDTAGDQMMTARRLGRGDPANGKVIRLGAAAREHDLRRARAQRRRHLGARRLECTRRRRAQRVRRRWVRE